MKCKITKANGDLPDVAKNVWPCNLTLHSLFSICRLIINEVPVIKQPDNYPYKAYFASVLSYPDEVKYCQLSTSGFYKDLSGHFDPKDFKENDGALFRNNLFRERYDSTKPYRKDGARFFGRLHLDLSSIDTGIPFGTKIRIELKKSADAFVLMREEGDSENYRIQITSCYLYIPIAQLRNHTISAKAFLLKCICLLAPLPLRLSCADVYIANHF